jgi:hypothetical protein
MCFKLVGIMLPRFLLTGGLGDDLAAEDFLLYARGLLAAGGARVGAPHPEDQAHLTDPAQKRKKKCQLEWARRLIS